MNRLTLEKDKRMDDSIIKDVKKWTRKKNRRQHN